MKKLEYYKQLRSFGISEDHATRMTNQSIKRPNDVSASEHVLGFATWDATEEGHDYWNETYESYLPK